MVVCPNCQAAYDDNRALKFCGRCGSDMGIPARSVGEWVMTEPLRPSADGQLDPWIGRIVDGRYRVLERIGHGGMGAVYRVQHVRMGKVAAMKVLHRDHAGDREAAKRFRLEAEAVSKLSHPNIVQVFDFGQWEGSLYLVMEYVKGENLGAVLKREGPMPWQRAARLAAEMCAALTEAHEAGIIHRDMKPENIVVVARREGSEHVKVLDFGLAKLRERQELAEITSRNSLVGTPYYMSPEQVRSERLDARSDLYSLGATLYRMITGEPPFQAATPVGVLTKHVTEELEPPTSRAPGLDLPPAADEIVLRAMAKNRDGRYPSAAAMKADLERVVAGEGVTPMPVDRFTAPDTLVEGSERLRREDFDAFEASLRRRKILAGLIAPTLALVLAVGAWWAWRSSGEKAKTDEQEPNNTAAMANLLPNRDHVHGRIGRRLEGGSPDLDYFRIPASDRKRTVRVQLDAVPGMDMVLELFDAQGRSIGKANGAGAGQREVLGPIAIEPGEAFVLVREVWVDGRTPTENVRDHYALYVEW